MNNKLVIVLLTVLIFIPASLAFELNPNELSKSTCQGNTVLFTASVFGTGNFNVNLDGSASSWSTAVPQGFTLNNDARTIYVYSTPNNNVHPGEYSLNLIVSNQQETKTIPFRLNVENCHNLQITGEIEKNICMKDIVSFSYQLSNLGNYDENYELNSNGPDFITLSQDFISLKSGESKDIYAYADQNSRTSSFTISASNQYGTAEITSRLNVNSCYDFDLISDKDFVNLCEHSAENFALTLTNKGINDDTYNIDIKAPEWANLDHNMFVLGPQESGNANIIINPDYGVKGNFDIDLTVNSRYGKIEKKLKAQVNKCNDVFIDIQEKDISLCNNAQVPVLLKNTGLFEKEFKLETSEQWASLNKYQSRLQPGDEEILNLLFYVDNLERKDYDVYVRALALDGSELSMDDKIRVKVLDDMKCRDTEIIADNLFRVTQGASTTLPITIKNNGNEKIIYEISVTGDASSFTQLNPSILELEPNSAETIYLYSAPSIEINPGDYIVDIRVSYNNNVLASKTIGVEISRSDFMQKEYAPISLKIANFFKNLFSKNESSNETIPEENQNDKNSMEEDANKTGFISNVYNQAKSQWIYIVVGAAIIIILIIIFSSGKDESENDFEEDEEDDLEEDEEDDLEENDSEQEKPLKVGRWVLGIVVVLTLIYMQMNYNIISYIKKYTLLGWSYVPFYKFYILIALIFLLIAILIIKYWNSILEFFEEEDDEPKKSRRKK